MLVLSRRKGESIIIQDLIEVTVLEVEGETIKIGIQAPRDIEVLRKEIYHAVQETNKQSIHGLADILKLKK